MLAQAKSRVKFQRIFISDEVRQRPSEEDELTKRIRIQKSGVIVVPLNIIQCKTTAGGVTTHSPGQQISHINAANR